MINECIKRLRKAADALDELLDVMPAHNGKAKRSISRTIDKNLSLAGAVKKYGEKEILDSFTQGYNDLELRRQKNLRKVNPEQEEGRFHRIIHEIPKKKKKHWTQTPAGRNKMSLAQKKMWANKKRKKAVLNPPYKDLITDVIGQKKK